MELDRRKLAAARLWASHRFPYLASGLFACRFVAAEGTDAMAVDDRWRLYVDPDVVAAWDVPELGSVMVHHVGHLLRDHAGRATNLGLRREDAGRWVTAADAEINDDLVEAGLQMPGEPVLPSHLGQEPGRLAEEYFRALPEERMCDRDCGSGCHGHGRSWDEGPEGPGTPGLSGAQAKLLRCQVAGDVLKHCRGQLPGTVPGGLRRWAEDVLQPRIDWRKALAAEVRACIANVAGCVDYSYTRPSRRASAAAPVVLPSLRRPVPEVAVVVDTSGSMHERLLGEAIAEVGGLLRSVGLSRTALRVISCDAAVHQVQRVSSVRQVELYGGGGTDMGEGLRRASELRPRPDVVVVLTDGYTPWPDAPPKRMHVVVGIVGGGRWSVPRWARAIEIGDA